LTFASWTRGEVGGECQIRRHRALVLVAFVLIGGVSAAYWQAAAQCGGIYFRLNALYSDAAATAKVVKPDPAAYTRLSKEADSAVATATTFFDAAEYFLAADRKLARQEAMLTYDPIGNSAGDRLKTIDAALQAAKPCAEFLKICRAAQPQACADSRAATN
jgi:hypothetical protein